jgi:hypothetical protein
MSTLAWIFGSIGGLCAVMGIITAAEIVPQLNAQFTPMLWLGIAGVLLLASIAFAVGREEI